VEGGFTGRQATIKEIANHPGIHYKKVNKVIKALGKTDISTACP